MQGHNRRKCTEIKTRTSEGKGHCEQPGYAIETALNRKMGEPNNCLSKHSDCIKSGRSWRLDKFVDNAETSYSRKTVSDMW